MGRMQKCNSSEALLRRLKVIVKNSRNSNKQQKKESVACVALLRAVSSMHHYLRSGWLEANNSS